MILLAHVLLLVLALFISLVFLRNRSTSQTSGISICQKIVRPIYDTRDLFTGLKQSHLLLSFLMLLLSLFFYDLFRMGSASIVYLYLHFLSFDDTYYAAYFSLEQLATCLALVFLALLRQRANINDLYLAIIGLCLSLVASFLFAFARNNKAMIFGGKYRTKLKQKLYYFILSHSIIDVQCLFFSMLTSNYCSSSTRTR